MIDAKNWPKTIEDIEEFLRGRLGEQKIPLAYVIRPNIEVPVGFDPTVGITHCSG